MMSLQNASRAAGLVKSSLFQRHLLFSGLCSAILLLGQGCSPSDDSGSEAAVSCAEGLADMEWSELTTGPLAPRDTPNMAANGSKVFIFGGRGEEGTENDGAILDVSDLSWTSMATEGAPSGRVDIENTGLSLNLNNGLWLIWGGRVEVGASQSRPGTGAIYDTALNVWYPVTTTDAALGRAYVHLLPRGDNWVVWGGNHQFDLPEGGSVSYGVDDLMAGDRVLGAYNSTSGVPVGLDTIDDDHWEDPYDGANGNILLQRKHSVVQSTLSRDADGYYANHGAQMIVWGGAYEHSTFRNDGAVMDLVTYAWTPMSQTGALSGREYTAHVWTGSKLIVWGGLGPNADTGSLEAKNDGAIYDPATDTWTALPTEGAPSGRITQGNWLGNRYFLVAGGLALNGSAYEFYSDGALYDTVEGVWMPFSPANGEVAARFKAGMELADGRLVAFGGFRDYVSTGSPGTLLSSAAVLELPEACRNGED